MSSANNIEVEIRSFISKENYMLLLQLFKENYKFLNHDVQETHYLDSKEDLRIQKNSNGSKIWLKKGKLHDDTREEIEIFIEKTNFETLKNLFETIGHETKIIWLRERNNFQVEDITLSLDYTKGYGYIIEAEILCPEEDKEKALIKLKEKFKELKIEITPKEEFNKKYEDYIKNWRELIK
jgi:predicted adenylyl cyclase CyaB